jgi:2-polyprenyl-3-methyl-5-hydroxy-6-metoxy-1,4-benzoquinol methylase
VLELLARRELPQEYEDWNRKWGAPHGRHTPAAAVLERLGAHRFRRIHGPFGFQGNTTTRAYEYPWAYHQLSRFTSSRIIEIGGAMSGLQFVLAKHGHEVHNVDPFYDYGRGEYDIDPAAQHSALNRAFGTDVKLHRATLPEADLDGSFSAAVCVSTLEHLPPESIQATLEALKSLMSPGGLVVLTVDLFLNLTPFCTRTSNGWGANTSIAWLEELLGYPMVSGDRSELYGYEEFSTERILSQLEQYAIGGGYPQLAQLVAFQAPPAS